ncbi:hypothetical protein PFICI_03900 [Pestalotiopsis fici W106-1]|uniref:Uncharacterized protein n=1 Tax=Pestalotiopsis fici (strain W106-1 / CGMCC3.15140) TaxID=1229662 RepID=W3XIM9_PESFW|nr:uncharacterized protein PFICI_03900 [Pestalotiopsis fici W106-1]ETS85875.1 hypothetical protein PFICI_03900 [Pestalotiopsis fici W106-1]
MTGTTEFKAIYSYTKEPLPGLNKFGDVPNPHTQRKAARRRKNQLLRKEDPERYQREMADKKAIRDARLRAERDGKRLD